MKITLAMAVSNALSHYRVFATHKKSTLEIQQNATGEDCSYYIDEQEEIIKLLHEYEEKILEFCRKEQLQK